MHICISLNNELYYKRLTITNFVVELAYLLTKINLCEYSLSHLEIV